MVSARIASVTRYPERGWKAHLPILTWVAPFSETICTVTWDPEPSDVVRLVLWRPPDDPGDACGETVIVRSAHPSGRLTKLAL